MISGPFTRNVCVCIFLSSLLLFLPPANEVCEGYVFTGVGLSTGRGGMHGRGLGACMAGGMHGGGFAHGGGGACMAGDMCGRGCAWQGDMHGRGACMACVAPQKILWDTVNERAVHILLECILVLKMQTQSINTITCFHRTHCGKCYLWTRLYGELPGVPLPSWIC